MALIVRELKILQDLIRNWLGLPEARRLRVIDCWVEMVGAQVVQRCPDSPVEAFELLEGAIERKVGLFIAVDEQIDDDLVVADRDVQPVKLPLLEGAHTNLAVRSDNPADAILLLRAQVAEPGRSATLAVGPLVETRLHVEHRRIVLWITGDEELEEILL